MHILLTAATSFEIQPVINFIQQQQYRVDGHGVEVLIAGIGGMHTTYQLTNRLLQNRPDYVIQAGIGGSFSTDYPPGSVVLVQQEISGDLGVEENKQWKDLFDMNLQTTSELPYTGKWLINPHIAQWEYLDLPFVNGVSVNEITSQPGRIAQLQQNYAATVESMEGAALHYVCLQQQVPFIQIRSISNYVGERDKSQWKMKEAIEKLNEQLVRMIADFNNELLGIE
jgi:futalosine hydrolase